MRHAQVTGIKAAPEEQLRAGEEGGRMRRARTLGYCILASPGYFTNGGHALLQKRMGNYTTDVEGKQ